MKSQITGGQLRAARALLGWSVRELSMLCGVSKSAISRAEKLNGKIRMQTRTLDAVVRALEEHGIEFLSAEGLRINRNKSYTRL